MNRMQCDVVLLTLLNELRQRESWCSETHLQKSVFFLQDMLDVPLGFDFVLYKHGPYSFDLNDEITALRADFLLTVKTNGPYGPSLHPAPGSEALIDRYGVTRQKYEAQIRFAARWLAQKNVMELEKLGTALYVTRRAPGDDIETRARTIHDLKPHVRLDEAREALRIVDQMRTEAEALAHS